MINDNDEYCKNVDETISEKMKKSEKIGKFFGEMHFFEFFWYFFTNGY
jgi:hypothetical protein